MVPILVGHAVHQDHHAHQTVPLEVEEYARVILQVDATAEMIQAWVQMIVAVNAICFTEMKEHIRLCLVHAKGPL